MGEKDRPDETSERQAGPHVAKSGKDTRRYSKRIILVFIIGVGVLIGMITMQAHFDRGGNSVREREKSYRVPQPSGFAELAAEMRRDRKPVQVAAPEESKRDPEPARRIVIETPKKERNDVPPLPRYYSDRHDAQAANTLRTMRLQALTAKPVVENFELKRNEGTDTTQRDSVSSSSVVTGGTPSVIRRRGVMC